MATAEMVFGGGPNSSSGGELKLYLKGKRNTNDDGVNNRLSGSVAHSVHYSHCHCLALA